MAYNKLSTANLPDPVIDPAQGSSPEDYFGIDTYSGNGGTIDSDFGFDCDLVWYKNRGRANTFHYLFDQVRGDDLPLYSNDTFTEDSQFPTYHTQSFITGGSRIVRTIGDHLNFSGDSYVAWAWKAGTSFSNSAGTNGASIASSGKVSAESGFSIVSFNSGAAGTQSFKHGLSQVPEIVFLKSRTTSQAWPVWTSLTGNPQTAYGYLNYANAFATDASQWSNTAPTSTLFTFNSNYALNSNADCIAYCFHSVDGFSKFGSYQGGSDPFVYLGFEPAMIIFKRADGTATHWAIRDNVRKTDNPNRNTLYPSKPDAEYTGTLHDIDFLSNGFKIRNGDGLFDASAKYIYAAWAKAPFKYGTGV